jgi:hypothetical protein
MNSFTAHDFLNIVNAEGCCYFLLLNCPCLCACEFFFFFFLGLSLAEQLNMIIKLVSEDS